MFHNSSANGESKESPELVALTEIAEIIGFTLPDMLKMMRTLRGRRKIAKTIRSLSQEQRCTLDKVSYEGRFMSSFSA